MTTSKESHTQNITRRLVRRGFEVFCINPTKALLVPKGDAPHVIERYYLYLKKYSFRLFIRDVIRYRDHMCLKDLQKYCSEDAAREYLDLLAGWDIIAAKGNGCYRLVPQNVHSFGDTFEWFVAQVLIRDFFCPAAWGIRIRETPAGGDYDVIASVEENLLYIEAKSSPPKHVDGTEVAAFLDRVDDLRPQVSIFLEDTHLRMKDKIARLFQEELNRRAAGSKGVFLKVERCDRELFSIGDTLFIANSRPDMVTNIGTCIKHFLQSRGTGLVKRT